MSKLQELDSKYVANTYARFPVEIVSGKGSIAKDTDGKEYIDMGSGIGVTSFGIADDIWKQAVIDQLGKVQHMSNLYLYHKLGHPQSTVIYMKEFLDLYPRSKRRPEALNLLVESYAELDQFETARFYLENYRLTVPDSIQKRIESVESQEKYIAKLEKAFQKRIEKEQKEKLIAKQEAKEEAEAQRDDEEKEDEEDED